MSFFSYNYFKNLKRPEVYLAFPNKSIIGAIHTYDMQGDIMANSFNKISFNVYKYEDNDPTKFYEDIQIGKYVHLYGMDLCQYLGHKKLNFFSLYKINT